MISFQVSNQNNYPQPFISNQNTLQDIRRAKSEHLSVSENNSLHVKSALFQRRAPCKEMCECAYHRMKRYREQIKLNKQNPNSCIKDALNEYKTKIADAVKNSNKNSKNKYNDIFNIDRKFRKTEEFGRELAMKLRKKKKEKKKADLDNVNKIYEIVLKKRMQGMKEKDKVVYLINYIKMKVKKDENHLRNVRELIYSNLFKISAALGLDNILQIHENHQETIQKIQKIIYCGEKDAKEVLKAIQISMKGLEEFLLVKMNNENKENEDELNGLNINYFISDLLDQLLENQNESENENEQRDEFKEEEVIVTSRKNSSENETDQEIEEMVSRNSIKSNRKVKRSNSRISIIKRRMSNFQPGIEPDFKETNSAKESQEEILSNQTVPTAQAVPAAQTVQTVQTVQTFSTKENIKSKKNIENEHLKSKKLTRTRSIFAQAPKIGVKKEEEEAKITTLKSFKKNNNGIKKGHLGKKHKRQKEVEKTENTIYSSGSEISLSNYELEKIDSILDNSKLVPDDERIRKLFNLVENRIEEDAEFFNSFIKKMSSVLQPEQLRILKNTHSKHQFDKLLFKLTKQADHCIHLIDFEREKIWRESLKDGEFTYQGRRGGRKKTISLDCSYGAPTPLLMDELNKLNFLESRRKKKRVKSQDEFLEQKGIGEIEVEKMGVIQNETDLKMNESLENSFLNHTNQSTFDETKNVIKMPKIYNSHNSESTNQKIRSKTKVENISCEINEAEHLRILRYMRNRKPKAFGEATENIRNAIEIIKNESIF